MLLKVHWKLFSKSLRYTHDVSSLMVTARSQSSSLWLGQVVVTDMEHLQAQWNVTNADDDVTRNDIAHGFLSTKDPSAAPGLEQLLRLFLALMPEELHTFSVARSATLNVLTFLPQFKCCMHFRLPFVCIRHSHAHLICRYTQGHHIDSHDDRAYTDVQMEDGAVLQCSRTIAVIYYLTKNWKAEHGGLLRDCVTDKVLNWFLRSWFSSGMTSFCFHLLI